MFKAIAFLTRRPDLSHDEFVEHYENVHAKLNRDLLPQIIGYRRNYLDHSSALLSGPGLELDFDVVTEFTFEDRAAYEAMLATHAQPGVGSVLDADEENLFDRSRIRMYTVEVADS